MSKSKLQELEERVELLEKLLLPPSKKVTKSLFNELIYPFDNPDFERIWSKWKLYKLKEFKFRYKSIESEQAALNRVKELSKGDFDKAFNIINQSIANGWKGFFEDQAQPSSSTPVKQIVTNR